MTHTVFISYSTKTTTKAEKVRDFLESNGVKCWMAPRDLNNAGGQEYSELIAEAIEQCKYFLLVVSEASVNSRWVKGEINEAFNDGKNIIPLFIEKIEYPKSLRVILNQYQSIFAYDSFQNALSQLLACIGVEPKNSVIGNIELANHNKNYNKEESQLIEQKGKQPNNHNGHEYVDLGLPSGLKWATCNVGAEMPTDFGDFFAWGETSPDSFPSWWYDKYGQKTTSKYNNEDKRKKLESSDDAASMNWGDGWRMPTLDDVKELVEFCEWKSQNDYNSSGIAGYLGTSKKNGNTIFLPAAGCIYGGSHLAEGKVGFYWTSLLYDIESAHLFFFNYNYNDGFKYKIDSRSMGRSVRAVLDVR